MINLYHLKYFYDASRKNSLVKSAEINHITHSAISQGIRSLEKSLNLKLLLHGKRRFQLTTEGHQLSEKAAIFFDQLENTIYGIIHEKRKQQITGQLRVGFSHSIGNSFIPKHLQQFCHKHPKIDVLIKIGNSSTLAGLLDDREIDLGIGMDDGQFSHFESKILFKGNFTLVTSKNSYNKSCFLMGDKGKEVTLLRNDLRQFFAHNNTKINIMEIQSWELITKLAPEGMGIGLIPDFIFKTTSLPLRQFNSKKNFNVQPYAVSAFYRSYQSLAPAGIAFMKHLVI